MNIQKQLTDSWGRVSIFVVLQLFGINELYEYGDMIEDTVIPMDNEDYSIKYPPYFDRYFTLEVEKPGSEE